MSETQSEFDSGATTPDLRREVEHRSLRRRLETLYLNYTGAVYFLVSEAALVGATLVLGVLGTGVTRHGLRTQIDLTTAWSGVAGGLAIMYALVLGPPLFLFYAWDFIDRHR
ncbi:MAG: hypothetical protein ABEH77_07190 [Halobacteriaceae archaeon]